MKLMENNSHSIHMVNGRNTFVKDQPIILGLAGKAGSGKTSVAEQLVPKGAIEAQKSGIKWDHIFYALPLYEMASIKKSILGINSKSRKMYALHEVLYELYGGSPIGLVPDYLDLVKMVQEIESMPIDLGDVKPRTFLQKAGDICRAHRPNAFAEWAIMKSVRSYREYQKSINDIPEEYINPFCMIVSDVRLVNEAESILKQPNGIVICFEASQETLNLRLLKRDGQLMSEEHSSHPTENQIDNIKNISTCAIITEGMTLEQQTSATMQIIQNILEETNA